MIPPGGCLPFRASLHHCSGCRRVATSGPAARTLSIPAARCRTWEPHLADAPDHLDRCWLSPADKRAKREIGGRIGLAEGDVTQ